jgi:catechol 2,3-dioxygenase-like lactoylglutathione lyase family enzyme
MIDHVSIAVRDLAASARFYEAVLATLGYAKLADRPATIGFVKKYPEFWLNERRHMTPVDSDTGTHICLRASRVEAVAFHAAAIVAGGASEGAPGPRSGQIEAATFTAAAP